jgi:hypothetical protein
MNGTALTKNHLNKNATRTNLRDQTLQPLQASPLTKHPPPKNLRSSAPFSATICVNPFFSASINPQASFPIPRSIEVRSIEASIPHRN